MTSTEAPTVTVVMPVRNEEAFIDGSLGSVLAQHFDRDRLEVLVVDGRSDDATIARVQATTATHGFELVERRPGDGFRGGTVAVLDNPGQIAPTALNIGLRAAGGDVIARVDGHSELPVDYLEHVVTVLSETGAWSVGGSWTTEALTDEAAALAVAVSSRFGVGNVAHKVGGAARAVDSLGFPSWPRWVFERVGGFDEELVRNQDDEHTFRILQAGGLVWFDPRIHSTYYSRASLRRLARQHYEYGLYKVRVAQKRGGLTSIRHLVPATFVVGAVGSVLASLVGRDVRPAAAVLGPYAAVLVVESARLSREREVSATTLAAAYATLHASYGSGFLMGLWRWRAHHRDLLGGTSAPPAVAADVSAS